MKIVLLILFPFYFNSVFSQVTSVMFKPLENSKFTKLFLCKFNSLYGTYEKTNTKVFKKDDYFYVNLNIQKPTIFQVENEEGMGMGNIIYIEPGEKLKLDFFWTEDGVVGIKDCKNKVSNSSIYTLLYDTIVAITNAIKPIRIKDKQLINNYVEDIFSKRIFEPFNKLKKEGKISIAFQTKILLPQFHLLKQFIKNEILQNSVSNILSKDYFYSDSLFQHPNYSYWTSMYLEYSYFKDYIFEKLNNGEARDLDIFLKNIKEKIPVYNDIRLKKVLLTTGLTVFFEKYRVNDDNIDKTVRKVDSLLKLFEIDKSKLHLPSYIKNNKQKIEESILKNITVLSLNTNELIPFNNVFSDTNFVYLIDYWASWCPPCLKELPFSKKIGEKHEGRIKVIYLSVDENETACRNTVFSKGLDIRNCYLRNNSQSNLRAYKELNSSPGIPVYQFIYYKRGKWYLEPSAMPSDDKIISQIENILFLNK